MERVKKWCQAHQKACLITGIIGMLLSPFLWPLFLAVIVQSLTLGLPIAAGIYCYKYLNEQKHSHPETKKPAPGKVRGHAEAPGGVQKSPDETRSEPVKQRRKQGRKQGRKRGVSGGDGPK